MISGPNTGGKTVALKTVGLAVLAAQSGIPVAAQSARLGIFDRVLADIGDEQSIAADLSTFSAHMLNLKSMLGDAYAAFAGAAGRNGHGHSSRRGRGAGGGAAGRISRARLPGAGHNASRPAEGLCLDDAGRAECGGGIRRGAAGARLIGCAWACRADRAASPSRRRLGLPEGIVERAKS